MTAHSDSEAFLENRFWLALCVFLTLLILTSAFAYALILHQHLETPPLSRLLMWCPGASALGTCLLLRIPISGLGWSWPAWRYLVLSYWLPLVYALPVYVTAWIAVGGSFAFSAFARASVVPYGLGNVPVLGCLGVAIPLLFSLNVASTVMWALGEELGWRGFLVPVLSGRVGLNWAAAISGSLWAVWHYPGLIWADYNAGTSTGFALICFTLMVVALGFIMALLRMKSGSVWPCVLLHATHNTFVQGLFDAMTAPVGRVHYVTSEFGAGLAITTSIAACVLFRRKASSRS